VVAERKGFLTQLMDAKANCKKKICDSPFGTFLNNAMLPVSAFSGGMLGPCCPTIPTQADLKAMGLDNPANKAAADIMKEEANAPARRKAVRYLGTVDCHWWPSAKAALIVALRQDTNECVRLEAALALGRGCCCTKETIEALSVSSSGSDRDGNPSENSDRVRWAAEAALTNCLARVCTAPAVEPPQVEPVTPEKPKPEVEPPQKKKKEEVEKPGGVTQADSQLPEYYAHLAKVPFQEVVARAERTLAEMHKNGDTLVASRIGDHSVIGILKNTIAMGPARPSQPIAAQPAVAQQPAPAAPVQQASNPVAVQPVAHQSPPTEAPHTTPAVVQPETKPVIISQPEARPLFIAQPEAKPVIVSRTMAVVPQETPQYSSTQLLGVLRYSTDFSQREWAIDNLSRTSWRTDPNVLPALLKSAREDGAPVVRVACVKCLGEMGCNTMNVLACLKALESDVDPRVRQAAQEALARLATN
jgi:hypothetical protein